MSSNSANSESDILSSQELKESRLDRRKKKLEELKKINLSSLNLPEEHIDIKVETVDKRSQTGKKRKNTKTKKSTTSSSKKDSESKSGNGTEEFQAFMMEIQNSTNVVGQYEEKWGLDVDFDIADDAENVTYVNSAFFEDHFKYKMITLTKLVERLTSADSEIFLNKDFLRIHSAILPSEELLVLLKLRFLAVTKAEDPKEKDVVGLRVFNLIRQWISSFYGDWYENVSLKILLDDICVLAEKHDLSKYSTLILSMYAKKKENYEDEVNEYKKKIRERGEPPEPELPGRVIVTNFLDVSSLEIARQLTLIDYVMLHNITVQDIALRTWLNENKKDKGEKKSPVTAYLLHSTYLQYWIGTEVFSADSPRQRIFVVNKFIEIIACLLDLNNYNSSIALFTGLQSLPISRIDEIWTKLKPTKTKLFEDFRELFTPTDNYKNLREKTMPNQTKPCIPYFGLCLSDVVEQFFIYDQKPYSDSHRNDLFNFESLQRVSKQINDIMSFKDNAYQLLFITNIRDFIMSVPLYTSKTIWEFSDFVQPQDESTPPPQPKEELLHPTREEIYPSYLRKTHPNPKKFSDLDGSLRFGTGVSPGTSKRRVKTSRTVVLKDERPSEVNKAKRRSKIFNFGKAESNKTKRRKERKKSMTIPKEDVTFTS